MALYYCEYKCKNISTFNVHVINKFLRTTFVCFFLFGTDFDDEFKQKKINDIQQNRKMIEFLNKETSFSISYALLQKSIVCRG